MKARPSTVAIATAFLMSALLHAEESVKTDSPQGKLQGPVTHKNLQIFLVTGEERLKEVKVKLLDEAMKDKSAVVHETGKVNELSIQNNDADAYVYVQSGDIVKGGRQDRTLPNDFLVKAKSGKLPVEAFCVEHGRWQQRGKESAGAFSGSTKSLSSNSLKYAAKVEKSQSKVWEKVAKEQQKLSANVYKGEGEATPAAPNQTGTSAQAASAANTVNDAASASSLQLSLENKDLAKMVKEYTEALWKAPDQSPGSIGFAYAVNGIMTGAEIYANGALFRKLWPKLLESVVHEAIGEHKEGVEGSPVEADAASAWLDESAEIAAKREDYPAGNATLRREAKDSVRFDTLVPAPEGKAKESDWIHRSVLKKEKE